MNSIKTVIIVVVLAAVGYVVYVSISGHRKSTPPPGAPNDVADVKVVVPEMGHGRRPGSAGATVDAAGGGQAPPFVATKSPPVGVQLPGSPGGPSAAPEVGRTNTPPRPPSSPDMAPAVGDPPATRQAQHPEGEIRAAFAEFITDAHCKLDAALAAQDPDRLAFRLEELSQWYKAPEFTPAESRKLIELLDQVAGTLIYSRQHLMEAPYQVRSGDTLPQIAQRHNVPWELLAKVNGIRDPQNVQPGQDIKVLRGPFHALIDLDDHEMTLLLQGRYYAGRFPVAIARDQEALLGDHTVLQKTPAAANDPQGEVSLQLSDRLTIQGAGQADPAARNDDSSGSIRLGRRDIEDVYDILSVGSRVFIRR